MTIKHKHIPILDDAFRATHGSVEVSITRHRHVVQISVQDGPNGQSYEMSLEGLAKVFLNSGAFVAYEID